MAGYIGNFPTALPLTSSDLTDGLVTTAKIANDAVDASKFDETDDYAFTGTVSGAGGGIFESQLLHVRDEQTQGTGAGNFTAGQTVIRDLNTVKTNEITGASLSSNQITLPSGTYYIQALIPCFDIDRNQGYLYNVTDTANEIIGISHLSSGEHYCIVTGRFTISSQKVFEIKLYGQDTRNDGLGFAVNQTTEVFTDVQIWKVA